MAENDLEKILKENLESKIEMNQEFKIKNENERILEKFNNFKKRISDERIERFNNQGQVKKIYSRYSELQKKLNLMYVK